jgi:hypothetical protein
MGDNFELTIATTTAAVLVNLQHHSAVNRMESPILQLYHLSHKEAISHLV